MILSASSTGWFIFQAAEQEVGDGWVGLSVRHDEILMFVLLSKLEDRPQFWAVSFKVWSARRKPAREQECDLQEKMDIQSGEGRHNSLQ